MLALTPGNLITHLRKLEEAGYVVTVKTAPRHLVEDHGNADQPGRAALDNYTKALRGLLDGL